MKRSSSYLSLAAAVILLLVLTAATKTEAIRLDAETRATSVSSRSNPIVNKPSDDVVKGSTTSSVKDTTSSTVAAGEVKAVAHSLPGFQEDYYAPNVHGPRHH